MLEGTLVRLRATETEDRERVHRWMNDPEVTEYLTERYPSGREHEHWLAGGEANSFGLVRLAIETKEGLHIGAINLHWPNAEDRVAALGIVIGAKDCWDRGYGRDAVITLLRFAFGEMGLHRVWLTTLEYNERGIACYLKCGFRHEGRLRQDVFRHGRYWDFALMGILREEFDAQHGAAREEGEDDAGG